MFTLTEIAAMRRECEALKLAGVEYLTHYTDVELQFFCNGIGADWMPAWLVELIDLARPEAVLPSLIHDVEWHEAQGTLAHFTASNRRFTGNIIRIVKQRYRWYDPRRALGRLRARRLQLYLEIFGWPHYRACHLIRRKKA